MKTWITRLSLLAALLLLAPAAWADEETDKETDKETAEDMEEAARKAMEQAQKMLERAKARRAAEAKKAAEEGHDPAGEAGELPPPVDDGDIEEIEPVGTRPETQQEHRLRIREERLREREQIREERRTRKLGTRGERGARKAEIREERRKRKLEIRAERERIRAERGRPAFYLELMVVGAILGEDEDKPITTRDRSTLEGLGGVLRAGGIVDNTHMLGVRMQTFVHLTRDIIRESGLQPNNNMGSIFQFYMGPEYRYMTDFNLYFGFSIGGSALSIDEDMSTTTDWGGNGCYTDAEGYYNCGGFDDVRSVMSLGLLAEVGYELRLSYWFAMHFELFGALFHGWDDENLQVNNLGIGLAIGIGI